MAVFADSQRVGSVYVARGRTNGLARRLPGNGKVMTVRSTAKKADADAREIRRAEVSALLVAGASQREIAEELKVAVGTINADVKALRKELARQQGQNMLDYVHIDLARLDVAISSIWNAVLAGNLDAIETLMGIIQTRAKIVGYPGLLRVLDDEARGRKASEPGVTVNLFGAGSSGGGGVDMKLLQSLGELPADGLALFIQNMMLSAPQTVIVDGSYSNDDDDEKDRTLTEQQDSERRQP